MASKHDCGRGAIIEALRTSYLAHNLPSNLLSHITDYMETQNIYFCSHKGTDLIAYNIHGDYLGTIAKTGTNSIQWLTGFDFDSKGALYVALYEGFLVKYPMPPNELQYATFITPRCKDKRFERNIEKAIHSQHLNHDSAPEGVIVMDNDQYQSVFVTCMDPINGILQFSLDGVLQRIICPNRIDNAWSMERVPSFFIKTTQSSFLRHRNLFMVADTQVLRIVDIDAGTNGKIMSSLDFPLCTYIGDFTFLEPRKNERGLLVVNLQDGKIQFNQCEMFWMLKHFNINQNIKHFKALEHKLSKTYGTCIGPEGNIYICDHQFNRIVIVKILDYDAVLNMDKISQDMDCGCVEIEIFCKGMDCPNYAKWMDAESIGLNWVQYPVDVFEEVDPETEDEHTNSDSSAD
eukprot:230457_1